MALVLDDLGGSEFADCDCLDSKYLRIGALLKSFLGFAIFKGEDLFTCNQSTHELMACIRPMSSWHAFTKISFAIPRHLQAYMVLNQ